MALWLRQPAMVTSFSLSVLSNLVVEGNRASEHGGGLYIGSNVIKDIVDYKSSTALRGCTVRNNEAKRYGGIYLEDFSGQEENPAHEVSGTTVVKDNKATDGS